MAGNFQQLLIKEVREYFRPILDMQGYPDAIFDFLEMIGWHVRPAFSSATTIVNAFDALATLVATFAGTADDPIDTLDELRVAFGKIGLIVDGIETFRKELDGLATLRPSELLGDIFNALSVLYLSRSRPLAFALLRLLTLIRFEPPPAQGLTQNGALRIPNQFLKLRFDQIGDVLADPQAVLASAYWPTPIALPADATAVA